MKMDWERILAVANFVVVALTLAGGAYEWITFKSDFEKKTISQLTETIAQLKAQTQQLKAQTEDMEFAVGMDRQKQLVYEGTLKVTELKKYQDGTRLYGVSYDVVNKNVSKSLVHVTYTSAELYLGTPSNEEPALGAAIAINDAPDPWHPEVKGLVAWQRIAYEADIDDGPTNPKITNWMHDHAYTSISNGGLTGVMASGTTDEYDPEFLIRAKPSQYVDVVVSFGVDDSLDASSPNVSLVADSLMLIDSDISVHEVTKGGPHRNSHTKPHDRTSLEQTRHAVAQTKPAG
jgi:hypothetical protein